MGNWVNLLPVFCFLMFMLGVSFTFSMLRAKSAAPILRAIILSAATAWVVLCLP